MPLPKRFMLSVTVRRAWGFDAVARHSHGAFHAHSANALRLSMSRPAAPGSFDCVAARFATGNFAQDDSLRPE